MPNEKIDIYKYNLEQEKESFAKQYPQESKYALEYIRLLGIGQINKGRAVSERRLIRCLETLKLFLRTYKKSLNTLDKKEMEKYIEKLTNDKITRLDGKHYTDSVKSDFKIFLKSYLKYRFPKKYAELTDWFDTRRKKSTPDTLKEHEIELFLNKCKNDEQRFLICVLFDAGCRIEEFLNLRVGDITEPTDAFPYYKFNFKEEYSKTSGRDIGLYWKRSTPIIREFLKSVDKTDSTAPIFNKTYNAVRLFIGRTGKKLFNKKVHAHLMRKSSATYYADKLNRQQLCIRYGWDFSSRMPDVYIKRSGVEEGKVKDAILSSDLGIVRKENEELKTRFSLMKDNSDKQIAELTANQNNQQKEIEFFRAFIEGKEFESIETGKKVKIPKYHEKNE